MNEPIKESHSSVKSSVEMTPKQIRIPVFDEAAQRRPETVNRILILTLSTFGRMDETIYEYSKEDGTKASCKGKYQLDPVPRMLIDIGKAPDEIIIIVNKDTSTPSDPIRTFKDKSSTAFQLIRDIPGGTAATPLDYFVHELRKYPGGEHIYFHTVFHNYDAEKGVNEMAKAAGSVLDEIRAHAEAELFIDMHGGLRPQQEIINSVLSLLKMEGRALNTDNMFSVEFDRESHRSLIIHSGESVRILDFVSGMNALMNYGRADALKEYMDQVMDLNHPSAEIVSALNHIASGIQFCNIYQFETGIDDLGNAISDYESAHTDDDMNDQDSSGSDDYLSLFISDIKTDYQPLLLQKDAVGEIEWCFRKGYYQQLLTIVEARIPQFLLDHGIFSYDIFVPGILSVNSKFEESNAVFNNALGDYFPEKKRFQVFSDHPESIYTECENQQKVDVFISNEELKQFLELHFGLKALRNISNHASSDGRTKIPDLSVDAIDRTIRRYLDLIKTISGSTNEHRPALKVLTPKSIRAAKSSRFILDTLADNIEADLSPFELYLDKGDREHVEHFQRDLRRLKRNPPEKALNNIAEDSELVKILKTIIANEKSVQAQSSSPVYSAAHISLPECADYLRANPTSRVPEEAAGGLNEFLYALKKRPNKNKSAAERQYCKGLLGHEK